MLRRVAKPTARFLAAQQIGPASPAWVRLELGGAASCAGRAEAAHVMPLRPITGAHEPADGVRKCLEDVEQRHGLDAYVYASLATETVRPHPSGYREIVLRFVYQGEIKRFQRKNSSGVVPALHLAKQVFGPRLERAYVS